MILCTATAPCGFCVSKSGYSGVHHVVVQTKRHVEEMLCETSAMEWYNMQTQ
jgi:hypothetical protein